MAKFYGVIGYAETVESESAPGKWDEQITERNYYGDVIRHTKRAQSSDKVTDDVKVDVQLSIMADPYAIGHFYSIRYVEFMGAKWEVTSVEPRHPRLILTLGGLYNG